MTSGTTTLVFNDPLLLLGAIAELIRGNWEFAYSCPESDLSLDMLTVTDPSFAGSELCDDLRSRCCELTTYHPSEVSSDVTADV